MKGRRSYQQKKEAVKEFGAEILIKIVGMSVIGVVAAITCYLFFKGIPFFLKNGLSAMLLESRWEPLGVKPGYGISYMIGTTIIGSICAMVFAMPIGIFTAAFLAELAPGWISDILEPVIELLAGIPSIVYGMTGLTVITPLLYELEKNIWREGEHIPSGGANFVAAVLVLAVMILPTIIITCKTAIKAVPKELKDGAAALGAAKIRIIFSITLKSAESGILTAGLLSLGRVLGETMAVSFVSGGVANMPLPFSSVRFLTTTLVSEMGYAAGAHREALFAIGLILYLIITLLIGGIHVFEEKEN